MAYNKVLAETIRNYLESGVDLLLADDDYKNIIKVLEQEPCEDAISRQAAISAICRWGVSLEMKSICSVTTHEMKQTCADMISDLPKVEPVACIAKVEFDKDKMQEIVDEAVKNIEIKYEWIPIKTRPLTEEEKAEMDTESTYMYDCPLPDDGEEVEVTTYSGDVTLDVFYRDSSDGCYFEQYCDDGDVLAWRHKPEPYKAESEAEK